MCPSKRCRSLARCVGSPASEAALRGFCPTCGSLLFWKANDEDTISFALGAIDGSTDMTLERHIFVADKGDYYDINDDLPKSEQS